MACASSCRTRDHRTYGECLRSKGLSTAAGETTKASGPTQANDALTAKATPKATAPNYLPCAIHWPAANDRCEYCTTTEEAPPGPPGPPPPPPGRPWA